MSESLLRSAGRELSDRQLATVGSAVRGVLVAAAIFGGAQVGAQTLPTVYVTAPYPPGYGGGAGGAGGGSSTSNPGCTADCDPSSSAPVSDPPAIPTSQLPSFRKVECAATKYGMLPKRFYTNFLNTFAFEKDVAGHPPSFAWSFSSSSPPPGYYVIDALTNDNPYGNGVGQTTLYASSMQSTNLPFDYIDPVTGAVGHSSGAYTPMENAILVFAHEIAHQNGIESDMRADGYGTKAVAAYRADHGSKCP